MSFFIKCYYPKTIYSFLAKTIAVPSFIKMMDHSNIQYILTWKLNHFFFFFHLNIFAKIFILYRIATQKLNNKFVNCMEFISKTLSVEGYIFLCITYVNA